MNLKHGKCIGGHTRLYNIWLGMKARCYYTKHNRYKFYGGKGIEVCLEWKDDFKKFYDWAINNGYKEHLSIERIDINKNYCSENCKWIELSEQKRNTSRSIKITFNGKTQSVKDWSKETGLNEWTIYRRLLRKWTIEKTLTTM